MLSCRHCNAPLNIQWIDLGAAPPSNAYLSNHCQTERYYPLRVLVCSDCWLVQTEDHAGRDELFDAEYAYFSSFSPPWVQHAREYALAMIDQLELSQNSYVIEVGANDGYLLQHFASRGIPCLGIEPTHSTAVAARKLGLAIREEWFGSEMAATLPPADLICCNNVLAHVPDINDFCRGFAKALKPGAFATFEFQHIFALSDGHKWDTIYAEHYSYLSLTAVTRIFAANGLHVCNVQELPTQGGSLRIFAQRADQPRSVSGSVVELLARENAAGIRRTEFYSGFQRHADTCARDLLNWITDRVELGYSVAGYGAAAKGNTLLNYAGVKPYLLPYIADLNTSKVGKLAPGSRIRIVSEDYLLEQQPDYILILAWNMEREIRARLDAKGYHGQYVTALPHIQITGSVTCDL